MKNSKETYEYLRKVTRLITESRGMNVPYCESMDMSLLPAVILLTFDEDAAPEEVTEEDLTDLRFLAENGRVLPKELENASLEEFKAYVKENRDALLREIEEICDDYYEEYSDCGHDCGCTI